MRPIDTIGTSSHLLSQARAPNSRFTKLSPDNSRVVKQSHQFQNITRTLYSQTGSIKPTKIQRNSGSIPFQLPVKAFSSLNAPIIEQKTTQSPVKLAPLVKTLDIKSLVLSISQILKGKLKVTTTKENEDVSIRLDILSKYDDKDGITLTKKNLKSVAREANTVKFKLRYYANFKREKNILGFTINFNDAETTDTMLKIISELGIKPETIIPKPVFQSEQASLIPEMKQLPSSRNITIKGLSQHTNKERLGILNRVVTAPAPIKFPRDDHIAENTKLLTNSNRVVPPAIASPFTYTFQDNKTMEITPSDYQRLRMNEFLNDTLINFFLKYFTELNKNSNAYVFNTFFYARLVDMASKDTSAVINYDNVKKWTSKVNLFESKYVVLPVNKQLHWFVAIIYNLPSILEPRKSKQTPHIDESDCGIFIFDSLKQRSYDEFSTNIKNYLVAEAKDKLGVDIDKSRIFSIPLNVTQQTNLCDCGVFLIRYIQVFWKRLSSKLITDMISNDQHTLSKYWGNNLSNEFLNQRAKLRMRLYQERENYKKKVKLSPVGAIDDASKTNEDDDEIVEMEQPPNSPGLFSRPVTNANQILVSNLGSDSSIGEKYQEFGGAITKLNNEISDNSP